MLVPNLFTYRGYFFDTTQNYFLPTNHIIIYSSILATSTLIHLILYPPFLVKKRLTPTQYRLYLFLMGTTLTFFIALFVPIVAMIFSATTTPYLRYFAFFGVILILNTAFFYEHQLLNNKLLIITLVELSLTPILPAIIMIYHMFIVLTSITRKTISTSAFNCVWHLYRNSLFYKTSKPLLLDSSYGATHSTCPHFWTDDGKLLL